MWNLEPLAPDRCISYRNEPQISNTSSAIEATRTRTQRTTHIIIIFIHSSEPVKHATIVRHQIGHEQASKCLHQNVMASAHQECDAVLSANGRQRALQCSIVGRPLGIMFVHKVRELGMLRRQFLRIEVVAAPIGVHIHGDPVFSRLIGAVGAAPDCRRVRVDDLRQTVCF